MMTPSAAPKFVVCCALALAGFAQPDVAAAGGSGWNPAALQPDLTIEDAQVAGANPNRLRVRVANRGLAPAVETQLTLLYRRNGRDTPMVASVPLLGAGERQWLIVEVGAPLGEADRVVLHIDEPPVVVESDETNNTHVWGRSRP